MYERNNLFHIIERACKEVFIPITIGGGIRKISDIKDALNSGADKIAINTQAIKTPNIISTNIKTNYSSNFSKICSTTGPIALNNWFKNTSNLNDTELILFPPNVFEPCDPGNTNCILDKDTISIHLFEMSWISPSLLNLFLFYFKIKSFLLPVIFIILFIYFTKLSVFLTTLPNR